VSWEYTLAKQTVPARLMTLRSSYPTHRYFLWDMTETPWGKWRREFIVDPLVYFFKAVHSRNYEAGYDVAELEPQSREKSTYVLQEYFVPPEKFDAFCERMSEILGRYSVNMVNVSIRHSLADGESYLAWAKSEVFAFVMYYKQRVGDADKTSVAVWTRELMQAAIDLGGAYYLPYQAHATRAQFQKAYPQAAEFFALKQKYDPDFRFSHVLWRQYYTHEAVLPDSDSVFTRVLRDTVYHDGMYRFLQNVFRLYPEEKFQNLILEAEQHCKNDDEKYTYIRENLKRISPFLAPVRFAIPALFKQKNELTRQTLELLDGVKQINGYLEIGTVGRYLGRLKKRIPISGQIYLMNDRAPSNSPPDILDREGIAKLGNYIQLNDYVAPNEVAPQTLEVITCYIGLHHIVPEKLAPFIAFIAASLKPGGRFILRDHDVADAAMFDFVSLVHTVFNAGTGETLETEKKEYRKFRPLNDWVEMLARHGLTDTGKRILQRNDPTANTLMCFIKR
jgi:SAM-dependent methyltransferase